MDVRITSKISITSNVFCFLLRTAITISLPTKCTWEFNIVVVPRRKMIIFAYLLTTFEGSIFFHLPYSSCNWPKPKVYVPPFYGGVNFFNQLAKMSAGVSAQKRRGSVSPKFVLKFHYSCSIVAVAVLQHIYL